MKFMHILTVSAIALVIMASCNKKKSSVKLTNDADSISYCIGGAVAQQLKSADIPKFNQAIFDQAIQEALNKVEPKIKPEVANMYIRTYFSRLEQKQAGTNKQAGIEFLEKNKSKKGVITTASGLQYEVITEGTGVVPNIDDKVSVHYKGSLVDGTVFQSSYDMGRPATLPLKGVIKGWTEVLQLMKVGSKYKIYVPSELGYGEAGEPRGGIKPNSVLIFEMELLSILPKEQQQPAMTMPTQKKK